MDNENKHDLPGDAVRAYMVAGKAILTVLNTHTGGRNTYRISCPKDTKPEDASILFVSVLTGPENTRHYSYIGILILDKGEFKLTKKSKLPSGDPRVKGFRWLWARADDLPGFVEVYHHGHCGRCGRLLTVPESISIGMGPVCASGRERPIPALERPISVAADGFSVGSGEDSRTCPLWKQQSLSLRDNDQGRTARLNNSKT